MDRLTEQMKSYKGRPGWRLMSTGSISALLIATALTATPAAAQQNDDPSETAPAAAASEPATGPEIIVTGTSLRGVPPVGANLITVSPVSMQKTGAVSIDDALKRVPALSNMGQVGQGQHNSTYFSPNIHQMGGSSSSSTLVLMDGMRFPLGGTSHSQPDPSIIPMIALQRVDVLATGSSSIYGSDAVAGVVNFITRNSFDGVEVDADIGFADDYTRYNVSGIWGTNWDSGNLILAYQHSHASNIRYSTRIGDLNFIPRGGTNHNSFNCSPATIQPNGTGGIYPSPTATAPISSAQSNAMCYSNAGDYIPDETRNDVFVKVRQEVGDLELSGTLIFADRQGVTHTDAGTLTASAFGPGAANPDQINPFYINPPGVDASRQTVRFDMAGLLPESETTDEAQDIYGVVTARYHLTDDWDVSAYFAAARDRSSNATADAFCGSCALLALNGTTNSSGNVTAPSIPGTDLIVHHLPLTVANALDVWSPASSNRSSAEVLASLHSASRITVATDLFEQFRLTLDGPLFALPAGEVRLALGGEYFHNTLEQNVTKPAGIGPSVTGNSNQVFNFKREVKSAFAELAIPLVSSEMSIPLMNQLDVNISGRYDTYSDVGDTFNPKYAVDWYVTPDLKLFGSYSTSFVAPQLDSIGDPNQGYLAAYSSAGAFSTPTTFPTALYPGTAGVLPGCPAGAETCQVGTATTMGVSYLSGIGPDAQPEKGSGYAIGFDYRPSFIQNLDLNVTFWDTNFRGAVTSAGSNVYANVASLNKYFKIYPTGAPQSAIDEAIGAYQVLRSSLPETSYVIFDNSQANIENLHAQGFDVALDWSVPTSIGTFRLGEAATYFTRYTISFGTGGPEYSILNTVGQTGQFPEIQLFSRTDLGWSGDNLAFDLFINHTGSYYDWGTPKNPIEHDENGNPSGGGDKIGAYTTLDFHAAYNITGGFLDDSQVFLNVTNLLDSTPPFFNSRGQQSTFTGNNDLVTNIIGRLIQVGVRARF